MSNPCWIKELGRSAGRVQTGLVGSVAYTLALVLFLGACDNTFEPISSNKHDFFAVYGYLDTAADTQFIRVSPLRDTLEPVPGAYSALASTTQLATGDQVAWQDSNIVLDDGQPGLLFFATLAVTPGTPYRLEVRDAEGAVTRAVTQVPPRASVDPTPVSMDFGQRFVQRVTLRDQTVEPYRLRVRYEVTPPGADEPVTISMPFFHAGLATPNGLQYVLSLELDREEVLRRLGVPSTDSTVVLHRVGLEIEQLSEEWRTPDLPVNIANGFGFFGSIARYAETWTLEEAEVVRLGYKPPAR